MNGSFLEQNSHLTSVLLRKINVAPTRFLSKVGGAPAVGFSVGTQNAPTLTELLPGSGLVSTVVVYRYPDAKLTTADCAE